MATFMPENITTLGFIRVADDGSLYLADDAPADVVADFNAMMRDMEEWEPDSPPAPLPEIDLDGDA